MSELLGVLFAIFIATMTFPKIAQWQQTSNDNNRIAITAQQQKQFDEAVATYTQQNSVAIQAAATSTVPATITVAMLQATNALPASFSAVNPFGQTWQAEVLQPTAGNLQVLTLSTGGTALQDKQVNKIAALVPNGGFIPQNDSGAYAGAAANAYGASSSWTLSTANYTSIAGGHPAALLTFNQGQLTSNSLYRNAVPGQPQLNTMNTPLIMAASAVPGTACSPNNAIAQDGFGLIISCSAGRWTSASTKPCVHGSFSAPSPGTYPITIPSECTAITVSGFGGGGGGGEPCGGWYCGSTGGGAGGGATEKSTVVVNRLPSEIGTSFTVTVGDGGGIPYAMPGWASWLVGWWQTDASPYTDGGASSLTYSSSPVRVYANFPGAFGGSHGVWSVYGWGSGVNYGATGGATGGYGVACGSGAWCSAPIPLNSGRGGDGASSLTGAAGGGGAPGWSYDPTMQFDAYGNPIGAVGATIPIDANGGKNGTGVGSTPTGPGGILLTQGASCWTIQPTPVGDCVQVGWGNSPNGFGGRGQGGKMTISW